MPTVWTESVRPFVEGLAHGTLVQTDVQDLLTALAEVIAIADPVEAEDGSVVYVLESDGDGTITLEYAPGHTAPTISIASSHPAGDWGHSESSGYQLQMGFSSGPQGRIKGYQAVLRNAPSSSAQFGSDGRTVGGALRVDRQGASWTPIRMDLVDVQGQPGQRLVQGEKQDLGAGHLDEAMAEALEQQLARIASARQ